MGQIRMSYMFLEVNNHISILSKNRMTGLYTNGKIKRERPLHLVLKGEPSKFLKMQSLVPPDFQKKKRKVVIFTLKMIWGLQC